MLDQHTRAEVAWLAATAHRTYLTSRTLTATALAAAIAVAATHRLF